jgi:hypothetical protein
MGKYNSLSNAGRRIKNMVWNTSENYGVGVNIGGMNSYTDTNNANIADFDTLISSGVDEDTAIDSSLYSAAHEGAHVKHSKVEDLATLLQEGSKKGADIKTLNGIMQATEDYRVDYTITKKRPGYDDLRRKSMGAFIKLFGKERSGDTTQDTTKAISAWTYGTDMRQFDEPFYTNKWADLDWNKIENIGNAIMDEAKKAKSSKDSANIADKLYSEYYEYEDAESNSKDKNSENNNSENNNGKSNDKNKATDKGDNNSNQKDTQQKSNQPQSGKPGMSQDVAKQHVKNAMNTMKNMLDKTGETKLEYGKKQAMAGSGVTNGIKRVIAEEKAMHKGRYGSCLWTKEQHERIEREVCKDVHAGTGLLYCKGYVNYDNEDYNKKHQIIADENLIGKAKHIAKKLQEDMRAAKDEDSYTSDNGSVQANIAYRAPKVSDSHIFTKKTFNDVGGYVVDLLLDASGSQDQREESIRRQAFIIARACSLAGIPCRVTTFFWDDPIDIKLRLRDYDDPISSDLEVFKYSADHSNRDGLSILTTAYELSERPEENKILIVLSDGSPAGGCGNAQALGGLGSYGRTKQKYNGGNLSGVMDVANTVRKLRDKGIALMGIYVGTRHALNDEKTMYGNDFAYIQDMDTFVPKVWEYLHKQILKF